MLLSFKITIRVSVGLDLLQVFDILTSVKKTKRKKRNVKRGRLGVRSKLGASVPTDFERQKGIFDYLKWHEINRKDSVAVFKSKFNMERANVQLKQSSSPYQVKKLYESMSEYSKNVNAVGFLDF